MRTPRPVVCILLLTLAIPSTAMRTRHTVNPVAWSQGGQAVLLNVDAHGPEGGGSQAYWIMDDRGNESEVWTISSDFSPGDGSRPQVVSVGACKQCATEMKRALDSLGFGVMVKVDASACGTAGREVVATLPHRPDHPDAPWRIEADSGGRLLVRTKTGTFELPGVKAEPGAEYNLRVGPKARMVILIERGDNESSIAGVWRCPDGDLSKAVLILEAASGSGH